MREMGNDTRDNDEGPTSKLESPKLVRFAGLDDEEDNDENEQQTEPPRYSPQRVEPSCPMEDKYYQLYLQALRDLGVEKRMAKRRERNLVKLATELHTRTTQLAEKEKEIKILQNKVSNVMRFESIVDREKTTTSDSNNIEQPLIGSKEDQPTTEATESTKLSVYPIHSTLSIFSSSSEELKDAVMMEDDNGLSISNEGDHTLTIQQLKCELKKQDQWIRLLQQKLLDRERIEANSTCEPSALYQERATEDIACGSHADIVFLPDGKMIQLEELEEAVVTLLSRANDLRNDVDKGRNCKIKPLPTTRKGATEELYSRSKLMDAILNLSRCFHDLEASVQDLRESDPPGVGPRFSALQEQLFYLENHVQDLNRESSLLEDFRSPSELSGSEECSSRQKQWPWSIFSQ